ncbi:hypothetical protein [Brevibacillus fluminis]|uniref:hypothetical protein n=1 Tax=Brevibacillus fluminis TaxID=511487 RepID=UPI0016067F4E|nr:hypothetical protein [Brevibacillus fluminis]
MNLETKPSPEEEVLEDEKEKKKGFWYAVEKLIDMCDFVVFILRMIGKGIRFLFTHL